MKIVAYYRVSTKKQGQSGLGLDAQKSQVEAFSQHNHGKVIGEYTEVETGKNSDRPKLRDALAHARLNKATLVVAKLDRLSRNVAFTSALMESGVEFVACDNPHATKLTIHILAAVAENEARATSTRTKDALAAAKAKGKKLGSARPGHWDGIEHKRGWKKGAKNSAKLRTQRAKSMYAFLVPTLLQMESEAEAKKEGLKAEWDAKIEAIHGKYGPRIAKVKEKGTQSDVLALEEQRDVELRAARTDANYPIYEKLAEQINDLGHSTTYGKPFTATTVWRILKQEREDSKKLASA